MASVFVSMWCLNTEFSPPKSAPWPAWCLNDLDAKLEYLEKLVGNAHQLAIKNNQSKVPDLHLFTAPEFLFASHGWLKRIDDILAGNNQKAKAALGKKYYEICDFPYDEWSKQKIAAKIFSLGNDKRFPGLVLVPGTTFWKKAKFRVKPVELEDEEGPYIRYTSPDDTRDMRKYITPGSALPPVTASGGINRSVQGDVVGKLTQKIKTIGSAVEERKIDVDKLISVRNSAFVGSSWGQWSYDKMFPDESEYAEVFTIFTPGKQSQAMNLGGLTMGIEVCADHASGALRSQIKGEVDIHLIMSAYVSPEDSNFCTKKTGVTVFADTRKPNVYAGPTHEEVKSDWRYTVKEGGTLKQFQINM